MEELIDAIVKLVKEIKENDNSERVIEYGNQVVLAYTMFEKKSKNVFAELDQAFLDAPDLYLLILSVLFELFRNRLFLDKAEEILLMNRLPWDVSASLYFQIENLRFRNEGTEGTYEENRKVASFMTDKLMSLLQVQIEQQPYEKRNHKRIFVTSDTLLSVKHAPTQLLLELSKMLQEDFGYEVLLGIHVSKTSPVINQMWIFAEGQNYNEEADGIFCIPYDNCELKGYQQIVDEAHLDSIRDYIQFVKEWNPEFIWHVGGFSPLTDILGRMVTLVASNCVAECAVSEAQILFNATEKTQKYLEKMGQKNLSFWIKMPIYEQSESFSREQYGIDNDKFLVALVGNRLDSEINEDFILLMKELIEDNLRLRFAIIGKCNIHWDKYGIEDKIYNFGYCVDLAGALSITDIYLNPMRIGGGISALYALSVGVPVVTLPECDVALNCGVDFVCQDYSAMRGMIKRYYDDSVFYQEQAKMARKHYQDVKDSDNIQACRDVLNQIRNWLRQGEIV